MINFASTLFGKTLIFGSSTLNLGSGSTWPGHIALKANKNFIKDTLKNSSTKIVVIVGTNGKTTTGRLTTSIIREDGKSYLQNKAGANLVNGLASTLIRGSSITGKLEKDYLIFEADENALPQVLKEITPDYIICLDLFRDQLDRYGEVDSIAKKWHSAMQNLNEKTTLILNADDPQIAFLGTKSKPARYASQRVAGGAKIYYFGLDTAHSTGSGLKHGADTTHCPKCLEKLEFKTVFFSHVGIWSCPKCGLKRPNPDLSKLNYYPLPGTYNKYNALAAALFGKLDNIEESKIEAAFKSFTPAFGRGEKIQYHGKTVQVFLSKNPTSFNESLETINELGGKNILIVLNDRIPDGLDISWIWDIDIENLVKKDANVAVSGDRVYDLALRLKYAEKFSHLEQDLEKAINMMAENTLANETLYILPNYSAMLETRKILTGKKIL